MDAGLYPILKRQLPGTYTRIENSISSGVPDVNVFFSWLDHDIWIELKKTYGKAIWVKPSQRNWLKNRKNAYFLCKGGMVELYNPRDIFALDYTVVPGKGIRYDITNASPLAIGWEAIGAYFGQPRRSS